MLKERSSLLRKVQLSLDLATTTVAFFLAYFLRSRESIVLPPLAPAISHYLFLLYIILPLWAVLLHRSKAYSAIRTLPLLEVLMPALKTVVKGGFILMSVLFVFKIQTISRTLILLFLFTDFILMGGERCCLYFFLRHIRKKGRNYRMILIVGTRKRAKAFAQLILQNKEWGLRIAGFVDNDPSLVGEELMGSRIIGTIDGLQEVLTAVQVDEVVFVVPRGWLDTIEDAILLCEKMGKRASISADLYHHKIARIGVEELSDWPLLSFNPTSSLDDVAAAKRAVDVVLSLLFLIPAIPALLLAALAVKLTSAGPVFFKQKRCGLNGRSFNMLKFRTMVENAETLKADLMHMNEMSGPAFKIRKDPRITPIGRVLRKYSIDELPQFINVLKGDMSIVGPRPSMPSEVKEYDVWQRRRLSVRPGITCLWQIGGRNNIGFEDWVKLDLEYIDNCSLALDFKIILKTIPVVLIGTGV